MAHYKSWQLLRLVVICVVTHRDSFRHSIADCTDIDVESDFGANRQDLPSADRLTRVPWDLETHNSAPKAANAT